MHNKTILGRAGEDLVMNYLIAGGFKILERNYIKPYGEVDIIACQSKLLVFVEVKLRFQEYGDMENIILPSKQHKIIMVAQEYIARNKYNNTICRFDVALVCGPHEQATINYIENAFQEHEYGY